MARKRIKPLLNPSTLPGSFRSRVFIGGSYRAATVGGVRASRALLEQLKAMVLSARLHPIIADEFLVLDRDRDIHHDAIWLLSGCRTAIFEFSVFSGALMEIERTADYDTQCIVLYDDSLGKGLTLTRMLTSFAFEHQDRIHLYGYADDREAVNAARNWLHSMLRKGHAVK